MAAQTAYENARRAAASRGHSAERISRAAERAAEDASKSVRPQDHIPDTNDYVVRRIYEMDDIFASCKNKKLDMLSSAEKVALEWKENGNPGHACMIIAWKTAFDGNARKLTSPEMVGVITLHKFIESEYFSTDRNAVSSQDYKVLKGQQETRDGEPPKNYFNRNTMYIDAMCAKHKEGVGNILVLNAIRWALMRKCTGIIALSFVKK